MTNEHIEVVKRWRAGEEVSVEALQANANAANAAWLADRAAADAAHVAADAAYAAYVAADAAADAAAAYAARWVKRYEEVTRYGHEELTNGK